SGTDILLFNKSIYNNQSLTAYIVNVISKKVNTGEIPSAMIDSAYERIQRLKQRILTGMHDQVAAVIPANVQLYQNYPNPFNPSTTIRFSIPVSGFVSLKIFNVLGKEVAQLVNDERTAGNYSVQFNASAYAGGVYFVRLQTGNALRTAKMVYLK
ncbi:MAG: T9SS type A sorting domain-containing protein, partial [Bacteroidota bacterium]